MKILFIILMIYSHETCNLVGNMVTMKEIPLTRGKVALVDDDMYDYLIQWKWRYSNGYAIMGYAGNVSMHRFLLNADRLKTRAVVDHINGNKLDNRKSNLRLCSPKENVWNSGISRNNTTGFKGVYLDRSKFSSKITKDGKTLYLGRFNTASEAAIAYNAAALEHHGEFAKLNEIPG